MIAVITVIALGAIVIGTQGWYKQLDNSPALKKERREWEEAHKNEK